ncbi:MAG: universal stress protein [Desulfomonile tiedjei]|nr:universal stress protein [Desulfomonile tiedjei]
MPGKKILLCTDFSENSGPPLAAAVEYATAFAGSLAIVHVIDFWAGFPVGDDRIPVDVNRLVARIEESAQKDLETLAQDCALKLPAVTTHCRVGFPPDEILQVAREGEIDLIVMGTHGWTGVKHFLLGSVAERVVRTAKCPVLIVRTCSPTDQGDEAE